MLVPFLILKILHITCAAAWFGVGVGIAGDVRRTLELGKPHTQSLVARVNRNLKITIASGWLTLLTGVGVIFTVGGFGAVPRRIVAGSVLTLAIYAVGGLLVGPTWRRIEQLIQSDGDLSAARPLARRIGMFSGIIQTLWLAALVLMVVKFD